MKSSPQFKKTAFILLGTSFVLFILVAGVGIWAISKTYNYVASSTDSTEVINTARNLALSPADAINTETISRSFDKPLLSQNCINSSISLVNPSHLLTKPINELVNNFQKNCFSSKENKSEPTQESASERI